jgi:hypothetical protein
MKPKIAVLLAAILLWTQMPAQSAEVRAREAQVEVSWDELPAVVAGKKVTIVVPDGAELRGNVVAVEANQLVLNVTKTSEKRAHPNGRTELPRASVTTLSFTRTGHTWQTVGAAAGVVAGFGIATPIIMYSENEGNSAGVAAVAAVGAAGALGYFLGRSADRKTVTVHVKN